MVKMVKQLLIDYFIVEKRVNDYWKRLQIFLRLWLSPLLSSKKYPAKTIIVLSQKEVINFLEDDIPDINVIEQRLHWFIYMNQTITPVSNFQKFLDENNMRIELDNHWFNQDSLCGTSAYKADTVIGKVKIIMNSYEMNDFAEGMILVTPMTAPEYP